jgi:lipoprotein signal peptidase
MENSRLGKFTKSFGASFAITSILSALLVVLKESNEETVLAWMKSATGHHWTTHGLLNLIVFAGLGWGLSRFNDGQGLNISATVLVALIAVAVVFSELIIAGFYL